MFFGWATVAIVTAIRSDPSTLYATADTHHIQSRNRDRRLVDEGGACTVSFPCPTKCRDHRRTPVCRHSRDGRTDPCVRSAALLAQPAVYATTILRGVRQADPSVAESRLAAWQAPDQQRSAPQSSAHEATQTLDSPCESSTRHSLRKKRQAMKYRCLNLALTCDDSSHPRINATAH